MGLSMTSLLLNTLVLLLRLCSQVDAYTIFPSCIGLEVAGRRIEPMIEKTMSEIPDMQQLATAGLWKETDPLDDMREMLLPSPTRDDTLFMETNIGAFLCRFIWTRVEDDELGFHCNDDLIRPASPGPGNMWVDAKTQWNFQGPDHQGNLPSERFCSLTDTVKMLAYGPEFPNPNNAPVKSAIRLILCPKALNPPSRGSLQAMYELFDFVPGLHIQTVIDAAPLTMGVLYSLYRAALPNILLPPDQEVHDWDASTSKSGTATTPTITMAQAKVNFYSLAVYALSLKITQLNPLLCFIKGYITSRDDARKAKDAQDATCQTDPLVNPS
ncbi:hypothetical protein BDV95DRAFT_598380 [Massariosphaeria phaeospora]|uniref:Uncharacterized protein n=1 Tax=Massariosphaeria phaeospora TaxID=100035 RepID=A0A7C8M4A6_9PLEO|nr:hypothetical protein BDV95DRAFT_598380 [Massariosphaeria phaeospora]